MILICELKDSENVVIDTIAFDATGTWKAAQRKVQAALNAFVKANGEYDAECAANYIAEQTGFKNLNNIAVVGIKIPAEE